MKKTLIVLMVALFATMLIVSCKNDAEPVTINIKYDVNDGAPATEGTYPATATTGDIITPTAPTRGGGSSTVIDYDDGSFIYASATLTTTYIFKGWKVKGSDDSTAAASYTAERKDVTLVAVWEPKQTISDAKGIRLSSKVTAGKRVVFGKYNDGYNDNGIEWTVLTVDKTSNKALLLSSYLIGDSKAQCSGSEYSWSTSPIKSWFGGSFISDCGLSEVKMVPHTDSSVGTVFLLSVDDVNNYGGEISYYPGWWWLRDNDPSNKVNCRIVNHNGSQSYSDATYYSGVRPAFWISL